MDVSLFEKVALLETPTGFAFFNVHDRLLRGSKKLWSWFVTKQTACEVIFLIKFIKFDDKSVVWRSDGPGQILAMAIRKYCTKRRQLIVGDEKLRGVIESNMNIECFDEEDVIRELMWGLRNVLYDFVFQERDNLTLEYLLPLSQGFKDCMRKYGATIPTEALDKNFIAHLGALYRCDALLYQFGKSMRAMCDPLVPDIGGIIEDDTLYGEVMQKILIPDVVEEWNPSKWFPDDVVRKIEAVDAAADDARKKVNYDLYCDIQIFMDKLRRFPGYKKKLLQDLKVSVAQRVGGQKRTHAEVVELVEGTNSQDVDCANANANANANDVCGKKVRVDEGKAGADADVCG